LETAAKNLKEASELLKKFSALEFDTDDGKKKRKQKDPNAPKRPSGSFFLFVNDRRPKLKKEHPELDGKEVLKRVSEEWNSLAEKDKKPWENKAIDEKERYQKALKAYQTTQETVASDNEPLAETAPKKAKKAAKIAKVEPKEEPKAEEKKEITSEEGEKKGEKEHKQEKSPSGEKKSKKDKDKKKSKKSKQDE
jgi:structure-specific recognition protein 1